MKGCNHFHLVAQIRQRAVHAFLVLLIYARAFLARAEKYLCPWFCLSNILHGRITDLVIFAGHGSYVIPGIINIHCKVFNGNRDIGLVGHLYKLCSLLCGDREYGNAVHLLLDQGFHGCDGFLQTVLGIQDNGFYLHIRL